MLYCPHRTLCEVERFPSQPPVPSSVKARWSQNRAPAQTVECRTRRDRPRTATLVSADGEAYYTPRVAHQPKARIVSREPFPAPARALALPKRFAEESLRNLEMPTRIATRRV